MNSKLSLYITALLALLLLTACPGANSNAAKLELSVTSPLTMEQGSNNAATVTLTRTNLSENVTLEASNVPVGVTTSFSENPVAGNTVGLSIIVSDSAALGDYSIILTGVKGDVNASTKLALKIVAKGTAGAKANYNEYSATLPGWSQFSPELKSVDEQQGDPEVYEQLLNNITYDCTKKFFDLATTPEKIVTLEPDSNILWVGALLQGKGYKDGIGSLRELPIRQRAPLTLSIDLLSDANTVTVQNPDLASVQQAIGTLIQKADQSGLRSGSDIAYNFETTHSLEQALLKLGISAKFLVSSAKSKLSYSKSVAENTVTAYFVQTMFTISMVLPQTPQDVFGNDFTKAVLEQQIQLDAIGTNNIPTYVANITYGRILAFTATSTDSVEDIAAAVSGNFLGSSADLEAKYKEIRSRVRISLATTGGDESNARSLIQSGQIKDYFKEDSPLTTAKPISYTELIETFIARRYGEG